MILILSFKSNIIHLLLTSVEILRLEVSWAPKDLNKDHYGETRYGQDRKLLNFTHWLRRTSMKCNNFEGKYFWIQFSIRFVSTYLKKKKYWLNPEFTLINEHLYCCNNYSSNILRSLVFVHNVRIFRRKITSENSVTSSVQ